MRLADGERVHGKWTKKTFYVERLLGEGANGQVYLVRTQVGLAAMKVCERSSDIALEWGILQKLSAVSDVFPKPMLIDDDPPDLFFYVMEWIEGQPFHKVVPTLTTNQFHEVVSLLLKALAQAHNHSYAFCDLKPDNVMVSLTDNQLSVKFVDVGGVTAFGRSVRQFTPYFDRGFWGVGTRKAEASYDLCALALTVLLSCKRPPDTLMARTPEERRNWLWKALKKFDHPQYVPLLKRVLSNQVTSYDQFYREWQAAGTAAPMKGHAKTSGAFAASSLYAPGSGRLASGTHAARPRRQQRAADWTEWLMWFSLTTAATVTLAAWGAMLGII